VLLLISRHCARSILVAHVRGLSSRLAADSRLTAACAIRLSFERTRKVRVFRRSARDPSRQAGVSGFL